MNKKIDPTALEFAATILSAARQLSPEAVLYWSRNEEELTALLEKRDFDAITQVSTEPYPLPSLAQVHRKAMWGKRLMGAVFLDDFTERVAPEIPATPRAGVHVYKLNVQLDLAEIQVELDDPEFLVRSAFTYAQIVYLAGRHRGSETSSPRCLDYHVKNYLPMVMKNGNITLVGLQSRKDFKAHKGWQAHFTYPKWRLRGNLLIKEDIPDMEV